MELRILEALDDYREAMAEGTPHSRAKIGAYGDLMGHFSRVGRSVFLATELGVLYPDEPAIVPDLLGVMDVADPERERNSWRVMDEGRGIDVVLEFRNLGKKHKDLVENVADYARLGIKEYFSFDCVSLRLRGFRLLNEAARAYAQLMPQGGVYASSVLGIELGVVGGRLRFFKDGEQIPSSDELIGRLQQMTSDYQERLAQSERARTAADERLVGARSALAEHLLRTLSERGVPLTDAQRAHIGACDDLGRLLLWVEGAPTAVSASALLSLNCTHPA